MRLHAAEAIVQADASDVFRKMMTVRPVDGREHGRNAVVADIAGGSQIHVEIFGLHAPIGGKSLFNAAVGSPACSRLGGGRGICRAAWGNI